VVRACSWSNPSKMSVSTGSNGKSLIEASLT
jgi:hypothetical protein